MAGTQLAKGIGCSASHAYSLETGASKDWDSYGRLLDALGLDRKAVLGLVTAESQTFEPSQLEYLLLDGTATTEAVNPTCSPAAQELVDAELLRNALAVLLADCSKTKKVGEICRLTRHRQKLTQRAVGSRIGRSNMYVSSLESGQLRLDRYPPLVRVLGLDDKTLFEIIDAGPTAESNANLAALLRGATAQQPGDTFIAPTSANEREHKTPGG